MKRTVRLLAVPTLAMLILASCGTNSTDTEASPASSGEQTETAEEATDESEAWPIVEDEDGNVEENPEGAPMDDGGDDTGETGNVTTIEFGDGEQLEFDLDAATGQKPLTPGIRVYGLSESGGDFVITTKIDPVEDLESYREKAGGEPVSYMSVDIDNREGSENINMYQIAVYDAAGNEYIFTSADESADEWRELLGTGNSEAYNEGVDLSNKYLNQGASPHQRSTMILTGPELPAEFTAVMAMPRGAFEIAPTTPLKD